MANLIPPDAKKALQTEYWIRVVTVWFSIIGFAVLGVAILKFPTYVLVQSQLNAFSQQYDTAREQAGSFKEAQDTIFFANELTALLLETPDPVAFAGLIERLDTIGGSGIEIESFRFEQADGALTSVSIQGVAETRIALATFSDNLEAQADFAQADVPISNLVQDSDIRFNIDIVLDE